MSRYYDDFLCHGWGKSPKAKAAEKKYNAWYYKTHKDKWKTEVKYADDDPDNPDFSYNGARRVNKDSDFFVKQGKNGNWIILEEDMMWEMPAGRVPNAHMFKELDKIEADSHEEWTKKANQIISNPTNSDVDARLHKKAVTYQQKQTASAQTLLSRNKKITNSTTGVHKRGTGNNNAPYGYGRIIKNK